MGENPAAAADDHHLDRGTDLIAPGSRYRSIEGIEEILKDLDHYLTEREAEPFREVARGVIGKARENLGAAFKLACQDRQWGIAISLGEQISREFPNSRMAQEVQDMLPSLRQRAGEHVGS